MQAVSIFLPFFNLRNLLYLIRRTAARLLEVTSDTIGEIAARCGYATYSHFFRSFCRAYGLSPEAWRQARRIGG